MGVRVPLVFVPGNLDPDQSGDRQSRSGCRLLLHGHVHPHGAETPARTVGGTNVCNVTGWRLLDLTPGSGLTELDGGYRHAG